MDAATSVPLQFTHGGSIFTPLVGVPFSLIPAAIALALIAHKRPARTAAIVYASIAMVVSGGVFILFAANPGLLRVAAKPYAPLEYLWYARLVLQLAIGICVLLLMRNETSSRWTAGRYRYRTRLRWMLPYTIARRIPKGAQDCGNHQWYNVDGVIERCSHCRVGERPRQKTELNQ